MNSKSQNKGKQKSSLQPFAGVLPFTAGLAAAGLYVITVKRHPATGLILLSPLLVLAILRIFKHWREGH
jgi:hypothetical protein